MIRHWFIKLLAGKDTIIINARLPAGIEVGPKEEGRMLVVGNRVC